MSFEGFLEEMTVVRLQWR